MQASGKIRILVYLYTFERARWGWESTKCFGDLLSKTLVGLEVC